jgi:formylmethanofuran dehydrogenase subunit E
MSRFEGMLCIAMGLAVGIACSPRGLPPEVRAGGAQPSGEVEGRTDEAPDWFYPAWAATAEYNRPIVVLDTDSALGRYSLRTKELGLKDLARMHGHLCDGLVIGFIQIRSVLERLFPSGIVDRTDLRAVSKNGPCWVDAVAFMTGARINFQSLRIDNAVGDGFIIQRISTGETYSVHLKPGVFPEEQAALENAVRRARAEGRKVSASDVDALEQMANELGWKLLNTPASDFLEIERLEGFRFVPNDLFGERGDVINKEIPR